MARTHTHTQIHPHTHWKSCSDIKANKDNKWMGWKGAGIWWREGRIVRVVQHATAKKDKTNRHDKLKSKRNVKQTTRLPHAKLSLNYSLPHSLGVVEHLVSRCRRRSSPCSKCAKWHAPQASRRVEDAKARRITNKPTLIEIGMKKKKGKNNAELQLWLTDLTGS